MQDKLITKALLDIYIKYGNDIDGLYRCGRKEEKEIAEDHWHLIDDLVQDEYLLRKNLTSETYRRKIIEKKHNQMDNEARNFMNNCTFIGSRLTNKKYQ